jgi:EAL domain-containing protein (putative c-di-GMP-specific phosphodiesterase class I)
MNWSEGSAIVNRTSSNHHLDIPSPNGEVLRFEMQPILGAADHTPCRFELLYRGRYPRNWPEIDSALLQYFATPRSLGMQLFINVSNEGLMQIDPDTFVAAARSNDVIFELSESVRGHAVKAAIAARVNSLLGNGVRFAIDDFGAGRDGLDRIYSHTSTWAVKIDSGFLRTCMARPDAAQLMRYIVAHWRGAGIVTIAEGIEDNESLVFARELGADLVQGWHIDDMVSGMASRSSVLAA